jgi:hypothetical protein
VLQLYDSASSGRRGIYNLGRGYQECSENNTKKESESQKQIDDIHVNAVHFAKLAITRDKDLMDFEMGDLKNKKKKK